MNQLRCTKCGKLLMKYEVSGYLLVEVKCPRCNQIVKLSVEVKSDEGK